MDINMLYQSTYKNVHKLRDIIQRFFFNEPFYRSKVNIKCTHATMIVWLQNNAGASRWGPTETRVEAILEAFRPGRERERDKIEKQVETVQVSTPTTTAAASVISTPTNVQTEPPDLSTTPKNVAAV